MKKLKFILGFILTDFHRAISLSARADNSTNAPVKPYPLNTCLVCGMELGIDGRALHFYLNADQEIKVCAAIREG